MKQFISIQSNQLAEYDADKTEFVLMSEIVICSVETAYTLTLNEEKKAVTAKYPDIQTMRFNATVGDLTAIRDRISQEIEVQKQLQCKFGK